MSDVVYADMCADLFHFGHVRFLERARHFGGTLVVGVHSDATVERYKRRPIMSMTERVEVIQACRFVDIVVPDAPLQPTVSYLSKWKVDLICHGDDLTPDQIDLFYGHLRNMYPVKLLRYTPEISTTLILERVRSSGLSMR